MKLHGDPIALIGPNEAGKSSILQGLAMLGSDAPFARTDEHRRSYKSPQLAWCFQLDQDDKIALAEVPEASSVERIVITKGVEGTRAWTFHPSEPVRDRAPRNELAGLIEQFIDAPGVGEIPHNPDDDYRDSLRQALEAIRADADDLGSERVNRLGLTAAHIDTLDLGFSLDELENEDGDNETQAKRQLVELRDRLRRNMLEQARREAAPTPAALVRRILEPRLPYMVMYSQEDRDLQGSYDLEQVAEDPPPALSHLTYLANLKLSSLWLEIRSGWRADVVTRRNNANRTLRAAFDKSWNQQKVALEIDVDGSTLFVHAISLNAPEAGTSNLNERSDGMRWFASLLAFVSSWGGKPILLVDEIETHLHYAA